MRGAHHAGTYVVGTRRSGRDEIDAQVGAATLVVLCDVLNRRNMERHKGAKDRDEHGLSLAVNVCNEHCW